MAIHHPSRHPSRRTQIVAGQERSVSLFLFYFYGPTSYGRTIAFLLLPSFWLRLGYSYLITIIVGFYNNPYEVIVEKSSIYQDLIDCNMKQTFRETIVIATFLLATGCQPALAFPPSRRDPVSSDSCERSLSPERLFRSSFSYLSNARVAGFTERLLPLALSRGGASMPPTSTALEQTSSSDPLPASASAYNLVWSPGFSKNLSFATASLVLLHLLGGRSLGQHFFSGARYLASPLASMFPNVLLPFLASACCLLQLAINV